MNEDKGKHAIKHRVRLRWGRCRGKRGKHGDGRDHVGADKVAI